jgi:hypothetical protein
MDIASLPKMNRVTCAWIPEEEPEPELASRPPIWARVALGFVAFVLLISPLEAIFALLLVVLRR